MPMVKDTGGGGTEKDGSKSTTYCSHCYQNGTFRDGFTSSDQMVTFLRGKLKEQGFGWLKRWFFTSHIPKLERWKKR